MKIAAPKSHKMLPKFLDIIVLFVETKDL